MNLIFIVQFFLLIINQGLCKTSGQWVCIEERLCIAEESASFCPNKTFESQQDCRLSCGKYGAIWPMPTGNCELGNDRVHFSPKNVKIILMTNSSTIEDFLYTTTRLFDRNIAKECMQNCNLEKSAEVIIYAAVNSTSLTLDWDTNEAYSLRVNTTGNVSRIEIKAATVYGARHAFETLTSLVTSSKLNGLLLVNSAYIHDSPTYRHRGLLLDTARNFIPLRLIHNTIDAMAASKLNVFHWHVVDTHSFPLEISRIRQMSEHGAYSASNTYRRNDTIDLIKYARARGVRVIIEIEGPSHVGKGWRWASKAGLGHVIICTNREDCHNPPCGQLNPFNQNVYMLTRAIYEDIAEINAPEETLHMGGDEVLMPCWNKSKEIRKIITGGGLELSLQTFHSLWSVYHKTNLKSWNEVKRRIFPKIEEVKPVIIWSSALTESEAVEHYLPKEQFIVQTRVDANTTLNTLLANKGYKVIVSSSNVWYFGHGSGESSVYHNWNKIYDNRIETHPNILGGEACMMSDTADRFAIESRIWPRAGAAAERLWSNPSSTSQQAKYRFYRFRQRLISRELRPDAVAPKYCVLHENQCQ
ncbi:chitooligosaccharidolytic beta-N-acetylglucosaminidase-like isoform 1-T4 [Glossina fuscipes fuscipes]